MFRCQNQKRCTKKRIRTSREDFDLLVVVAANAEFYGSANGTTDPVALLILDRFRPVKVIQVINQTIRICGNFQNPLTHRFPDDRIPAAFRLAVDDFFIGNDRSEFLAPVDGNFCFVCKTFLVHLFKDPLCPLVI